MTASTETFESVRDRIMAHIRSRGSDAGPAAVHQKLAAAYAALATPKRVGQPAETAAATAAQRSATPGSDRPGAA